MAEQLSRTVIELVRLHRLDKAKLINTLSRVRHHFGDPCAAISVPIKFVLMTQHAGRTIDKSKPFALEK